MPEPKKVLKSSRRKRKSSVSVIDDNGSEKKKSCRKFEDKLCVYVEPVNIEEKKKYNEEDKKKKKCKKSKSQDIENVDAEFTNNSAVKKKHKEKVNKNLSNDEDDIKNFHANNDKKEKIKDDDSFTNAVKVDFKENNNNNPSKTIPSSTPLKLSKPKEIKLMKISTIPKVIKTILVYDRKPVANNKIVDESSRCRECEKGEKTIVPTADNSDEATKFIDNDHIMEYPEQKSVSNNFITLKSLADNSNNNDHIPDSTMTNTINNKKTNGFAEDVKCDKSKSINDTDREVPLLIDEKYKQELEKTKSINNADLVSTKNDEVQLKEITENRKVHVLDNVCVQPAVTDQDSTKDSVISTEEFLESVVSITADESSLDVLKPKRKRKRTRRKKVKEPTQNGVFETPVFTKPNNIPKPTNTHIKFDDDNKDGILEDQQIQQFQSDMGGTLNDQHNQQKAEVNTSNSVSIIEKVTSPFSYEKLCKEEIMKHPVMVDIYPKAGDIIAFKVDTQHYNYCLYELIVSDIFSLGKLHSRNF